MGYSFPFFPAVANPSFADIFLSVQGAAERDSACEQRDGHLDWESRGHSGRRRCNDEHLCWRGVVSRGEFHNCEA